MERLVRLTFQCTGELGDQVERVLVAELMGRTTNIYLLDEAGRILDCLRRVGLDDSAKRQALPGLYYQDPEPVEKRCPQGLTQADALALWRPPGPTGWPTGSWTPLAACPPWCAGEAALACLGDPDGRLEGADRAAAAQALATYFGKHLPLGRPYLLTGPGGPKAYAFVPIFQYGPDYACEELPSFASLLDRFYTLRDRRDAMRQKAQSVRRTVQNLRDRTARKMAIQEKELATARDREHLRQMGDLVTANLHAIRKGQTTLTAENFYDPEMKPIQIPLSPLLSLSRTRPSTTRTTPRPRTGEKELTRQLELGGPGAGVPPQRPGGAGPGGDGGRAGGNPAGAGLRRLPPAGGRPAEDEAGRLQAHALRLHRRLPHLCGPE